MTINGSYTLDRSENLESFLKAIGLKDETIQRFSTAKPSMKLNLTSTTLEIESKGKEEHKNTLTFGSPSKYTLATGFELEINLTVSGKTAKGTIKKGDHSGEVTIKFNDTGFTETFDIGGNVCKRFYKKN